ncbi:MAG: hypothetical protein US57_C0011G0046 [Candidatus Moranbacteria bacterium GW2011_GWC2_37_73]|nr:MAG: hypothetical protein UR95_C0006G0133 [Parcubacteria group bacterium GW2011_GWC1_36_108]KKQ00145.1 MAG: hypothetical protein US09_C0019G0005 [Candidatus Moranbacteria bacterium GW2011_GWD1_36_198]KKQ00209.1 MAG: hypothetical protein US10_C0038G0017 [Candidatus Moranbacteria bacterium GW2011_GWD2_36_198]KKQ39558.1 MAG: hypothetical protein US57_C0011G0046 [Candidatus Moranbacteria bacterium GW2011_GWC2_37_73]HAS00106.1 hypothetical protein [Candidatus Moranbacteria bacterium]
MYHETIDEQTMRVFEKIKKIDILKSFYLAGGTALAIELGHRKSIDLDFFSKENFSPVELKKLLPEIGSVVVVGEEDGTLHCTIDGVKVSFLRYEYELLFPLVEFEGVKMADERDIAAMKIDAISSRGSKKDFIDLYILLKKYELRELINFFEKKFNNIQYNMLHILKSLTFFEDAEGDPMPMMFALENWDVVKKVIVEKVLEFEKTLS